MGSPANRTCAAWPVRRSAKDGFTWVASRSGASVTKGDSATMSLNSSSISRDLSLSSTEATISTGWVSLSR